MRSVAAERVVLVGHSMGAAIALATTRLLPEEIHRLILIGSAARFPVSPTLFDLLSTDFPSAARFVGRYGVSRDADPALAEQCSSLLLETGAQVTTGDFLACDQFDARSWLADIRVPTCVISGEADRLVRPTDAAALAAALPAGTFVAIPDAGHFVMLEQPVAVADAIGAFLIRPG